MAENVEDYLEKGMYGAKEINPEEKKKFLGTYRERVILAMHKEDVLAGKFFEEIKQAMQADPQARLLLNSQLSYDYLRPYIHLAEKYHHAFSLVTRKAEETDVYLVLTATVAVDKETIFLSENTADLPEKEEEQKKSFLQKVQDLLKKD